VSHHLRHERIVAKRALLVEGGAEHCDELLEAIEARLESAELRESRCSVRGVTVDRAWCLAAEPWLVVEHRRLADIRHYVRCRPFGAHLEVVHVTAIEPAWWKSGAAYLLNGGAWWSWSLAKGDDAELGSWLAVVAQAITAATKHLAQRLARGQVLGRLEPDALGWW
jgi:hypothetical protein